MERRADSARAPTSAAHAETCDELLRKSRRAVGAGNGAVIRTADVGVRHLHGGWAALDVNERGDVVGWLLTADPTRRVTQRAVLWPAAGGLIDLGGLPPGNSAAAFSIDNRGDIVGESMRAPVLWRVRGGAAEQHGAAGRSQLLPAAPTIASRRNGRAIAASSIGERASGARRAE